MTKYHYNKTQMVEAFRELGVRKGDVVFSHINIGYFGIPKAGNNVEAAFETIFDAFMEVLGTTGTLVVPTFTYSFCKGEVFDIENTTSTCGVFTEKLRNLPQAQRSMNPIFSVAAVGKKAVELTENISDECFGKDSFWDFFLSSNGVIVNLNLNAGSTFIHYVEKCLKVPYRYDKLFTGLYKKNGKLKRGSVIFFCNDLSNSDTTAAFESFDYLARKQGLLRMAKVGRGSVVAITASDTFDLIEKTLKNKPFFLTTGGARGVEPVLIRKRKNIKVKLKKNASMSQIIDQLFAIPRDIISDGFDAALEALSTQVPMKIHEYPTGTRCWTWIVPEKWTCNKAELQTLDGKTIFSYKKHPLHVVSYSLPFNGLVSRDELFEHLYVSNNQPDAIPFKYKYYERDWGLCCSRKLKETLTDEEYKVVIDSNYSYGTLKVGETIVKGEKEDGIVLCAHLCHTAQANDGLSGVTVGVEVMRHLLKRKNLRHTYRLLLLPETIGSIAYLSHHEDLIPTFRGGLFLEALGLESPFTLQLSWQDNSRFDQICIKALEDSQFEGQYYPYGEVIGNDERQFNSPGVRVPMLSISRVTPMCETLPEFYYYREYHTDLDRSEIIKENSLEESVQYVLKCIDYSEKDIIPKNNYSGEVFLSCFGLHIDFMNDLINARQLNKIICEIDGTKSILDIALKLDCSFESVQRIVSKLIEKKLVYCLDSFV